MSHKANDIHNDNIMDTDPYDADAIGQLGKEGEDLRRSIEIPRYSEPDYDQQYKDAKIKGQLII